MAEVVVGSLMLKIGSSLKAKSSQKAVWGDLADIKEELQEIQRFIREADMAGEDRESVAVWLNQVRETAYDIEDILDESIYLAGEQKRGGLRALTPKSLHNSRKSCSPKGLISPCMSLIHKKSIAATQLNELKIRMEDILERGKRYDVWEREKTLVFKDSRQIRTMESSLVGIESNKKTLIDWLMDGTEELMKISVWGLGGLGKTTLVDQVYNSEETKKHFECRAWITVSQTYVIVDMLRSILKEIINKKEGVPQDIDTMDKQMLTETLYQCLQQERYLIVLDDVWSESAWNEICVACPKNNCRSRIMFTTRNFKVATSLASPHRIFELKPLQYDQAWELFCKIAFQGDVNGIFPQEIKDSAAAIVKKCDGLPLAIVGLAGLMHSKHSVFEWSSVYNSLNVILTNNVELPLSDILMLSFYDLPYYLKNCFLYCSVFPEDYGIKRTRIIRLWVAEGFVEEREGNSMEEVAEEYFNELIHKSMLQVTKTNVWGRPKECRIHSVMRQLAISISKKQNFCIVCEDCKELPTATARRLSIIEVSDTMITGLRRISGLRSLLVFATDASTSNIMAALSFRLLRVLDLHGAPIVSIPNAVSTLFHLRYFSVRQTEVKTLPEDLEKLINLQTLDLRYSKVQELTSVMKLHNLRHLFMIHSVDKTGLSVGVQTPGTVWALKDLQTLEGIVSDSKVVREVQNLEKLRSFVILEVKKSDGAQLCASMEKMAFLNNLQVQAMDEGEGLELESLASPPPFPLQKLFLIGHMQRLPHWFSFLNSLKVLRLRSSGLYEDPLHYLQSLPELVCLELHKAYEGKELQCKADGFRSLRILRLIELRQLNQITIEVGAMGSLQVLQLSMCRELNALPQGIESLTTLEKLHFEVSEELLQRMQPNGVEHRKICHIPTVDLILRDDVI